jgi:integrase
MKDQTMAKPTGLSQRDGVYQLRVMIPKDLQVAYGGRTSFRESLATSSLREANLRAAIRRAQLLQDLEDKRREVFPQRLSEVPLELAKELAQRVGARVLRGDDDMRDSDAGRAALAELATRLQAPVGALKLAGTLPPSAPDTQPMRYMAEGLTHSEAGVLAGLNDLRETEAAVAMALRQRTSVLPLLMHEARKLGLSFSTDAPGVKEAMSLALVEYRKATEGAALRDSGAIVETPVVLTTPNVLKASKVRTLRDVFERWKTSGDSPRSSDSIAAYDRALKQFEEQHPGIALEAITREMGDNYRTWLRANCGTPKTARDRLGQIKSLLKFAAETLEWTQKQPWRGLDIKAATTNKRRPWTSDEINTLFSAPLHTAYALPESRYGGREAAYWIPLVGLYTGARLGELCQLRTADVQNVEGIDVLVLTNEGEGQSIKSEAGHRSVPIHSDLVRLGFLQYVQSVRKAGNDSLWPALPLRDGKPSDYFGRWFGSHCKALGLSSLTFHYLRHTVRPLMRKAGHSEGTMDKVTGHKAVGSIGTVVYDHRTLSEVRDAVETIQYPALKLAVMQPYRAS